MKPNPTPQPAALPRARVMYANCGPWPHSVHFDKAGAYAEEDGINADGNSEATHVAIPCSVRPHRTHAAAKRAAKWDNLSDQEKVALAERTFWNHRGNVLDSLRAVLKLTRDLQ